MKITLSLSVDEIKLKKENPELTEEKIKNYLYDCLFEVCEDWVLREQAPDVEYS